MAVTFLAAQALRGASPASIRRSKPAKRAACVPERRRHVLVGEQESRLKEVRLKNLESAEQSILEHESDGTDTQQMADRATRAAQDTVNRVSDMAGTARDKAQDLYEQGSETAQQMYRQGSAMVQRDPNVGMVITGVLGFILGMLTMSMSTRR